MNALTVCGCTLQTLTICIVHLWAKVWLDKEVGKVGGHVVATFTPCVFMKGQGVHQVIVSTWGCGEDGGEWNSGVW